MREIKFRGFYKSIKEMEYYDTVAFLNFEEDVLCYQKSPENEPHGFSDMSGIELMQYTGLKDKNGTEIYEGDIYHHSGGWGGTKVKKYVVKFSEERAGYFPFATDDGCGCCADNVAFNPEKDGEVIGNVFENPELLGKWNE